MKIDLSSKNPKQLLDIKDKVKVSDLSFDEKTELTKEIEFKLYGKSCEDDLKARVLKDIEDSQADIDDIN